MFLRKSAAPAAILCLAVLWGCGAGDGVPREPVSGSVTFDGKPLATGFITFMPDAPDLSTQGGGTITAGSYSIPRDQGLAPGKYKVMITSADSAETKDDQNEAPGMPPKPSKEAIPAAYNTATTLTAEVKAGGGNDFAFKLERTPAK